MTVELLPAPSAASARRFFFAPSWPPRFAIWLWALRLFLTVSLLTRAALCWRVGAELDLGFAPLLQIFGLGLFFDLTAASYLLAPLVLYLTLCPERPFRARWWRWTLTPALALWAFLPLFTAAAEWVFWGEFGSRFNFIAVDYLLYTHEVVGNIRESYPVGPILASVGAVALGLAWRGRRGLDGALAEPSPWRSRFVWGALLLCLPWLAFEAVSRDATELSRNRYVNALSGNGVYEFFAAAYRNELDYPTFYRTLPPEEAYARLRARLPTPHARMASAYPYDLRRDVDYGVPERRLNVVLISVESLSADFMARYGNRQGLTPALDRLAGQSWVLDRLYANGTRTVRGLEALALSVPPTPGQSIVKRPNNGGLDSLGRIFADHGYAVRYLYGGYGYFDNMNAFFGGNGYQVVDRNAIPAERVHFENIWGVADEDLFTQALEEIDRSHAEGRPSFSHIMTTSNHRPYTYPDGRIDIPSHSGREGGVKYTDWAIGDFIDRARRRPWFADTLFLITADHCAASAGKTDLPIARYRVPALFYAPSRLAPGRSDRLASQIDLGPTLLGLLRFKYRSTLLGYDLNDLEPGRERAFISTYQDLGYLNGDRLIKLDPRRGVATEAVDFATDTSRPAPDDPEREKDAIAWYQAAAHAFKHGGLRHVPR